MTSPEHFGPKKKVLTEAEIADAQNGLYKWHIETLEQEKKEREEVYSVEHLTKLKTRKVFWDEFTHALQMVRGEEVEKRQGVELVKKVVVVMIDLDHFKNVNDTYGHVAGDEVLRRVSAVLIESVRSTDTVARYGGEELVMLMRGASIEVARQQAEKIREEIAKLTFDNYPELRVSASFGIASSDSADQPEDLIKKADDALYAAKHAGRNRVEVAE